MRQEATTRHLSDAEKNEMLVTGGAGRCHEHLQACDSCRAELAALQGLIDCFGESVRLHGAAVQEQLQQERRMGRRAAPHAVDSPWAAWRGRIGTVRAAKLFIPSLAAALLLAFLGISHSALKPARSGRATVTGAHDPAQAATGGSGVNLPVQRAAMPPDSDDLLMKQVAEQLDQNVPASMLPLTAMVSNEDPSAPRAGKEN